MAVGQPHIDLSGERIMVTGAGAGMGRGIAQTFAAWGARVAVSDREAGTAEATLAQIEEAGGEGFAVAMDVTDEASVEAGVEASWGALGGLDLLVNNAGVLTVSNVVDLALQDWRFVLDVNATGVFLVSRAVARRMIAAGRPASIISTSSISGKHGDAGLAHYSASKFAVVGFTQALAAELAGYDILVNAICPGIVETPMMARLTADAHASVDAYLEDQLIRKSQTPRDIAYAMAFLHTSRAMTGQALNVDGGTVFN
jgi:meso-butanediol dehydrogenase / (S,S)-butanediol dehydrogenase / diacetyl reductase